jgi:hypothetical protein
VFGYIETFYNRRRRHSTLGMLCPVAFEARYAAAQRPVAVAWKVGSIALRILGIVCCIGAMIDLASPGAQSAWTAIGIFVFGLVL